MSDVVPAPVAVPGVTSSFIARVRVLCDVCITVVEEQNPVHIVKYTRTFI